MAYQFSLRRSRHASKFPNRIREFRVRSGWNQEELASRMATPRSTVGAWEQGLYLPALTVGVRLAQTLGTSVETLYEGTDCSVRPRQKKSA
jgi:DNA-binding XRE family transcriptional regulator